MVQVPGLRPNKLFRSLLGVAGNADYGQIVVLAVVLGGFGHGAGGGAFAEQRLDAGEAEEGALGILGLGDAIGHQHDDVPGEHIEVRLLVDGRFDEAEGHRSRERELPSIEIGRRMAGVGEGKSSCSSTRTTRQVAKPP